MNIYIDESGSFVASEKQNAWNVVAGLTVPESARRRLEVALIQLKRASGAESFTEVKLNQIAEADYLKFLAALAPLSTLLFCAATDASLNEQTRVIEHKSAQAEKVLENADKMHYETGRDALREIASQITRLSPQLYVQLICQLRLLYDIVNRSVNYYVQRHPQTLRLFRWRFDQKNINKTNFEDAFEKLSPVILQSISIEQPFLKVREFNYSSMERYEYPEGKAPSYLRDTYGLNASMDGWDIGKILRDDLQFVDSRQVVGVQVIDLLASGTRKCLRGGFDRNDEIATALGKLMLQNVRGEQCLQLIAIGGTERTPLVGVSERVVRTMNRNARYLLAE